MEIVKKFVPNPSVPVIHAENVRFTILADHMVRMEWTGTRFEKDEGSGQFTGIVSPVAIMVTTVPGALDLLNQLSQHATEWEKLGMVQRTDAQPNQPKPPKH